MKPVWFNPVVNLICAFMICIPVVLLDAPDWAVFSLFAIVFTVHGAVDRVVGRGR